MAAAVVAAIVLTILLPKNHRVLPEGVVPLLEGVLLVALIAVIRGRSIAARDSCALSRSRWCPSFC